MDLSSVISGLEHKAKAVVTDVEDAAHSQVATTLTNVAKELLPLLPDGREASLVVTKLQEASHWAHQAVSSVHSVDEVLNPTPAQAVAAAQAELVQAQANLAKALTSVQASADPAPVATDPSPVPAPEVVTVDPPVAAPADGGVASSDGASTEGEASGS